MATSRLDNVFQKHTVPILEMAKLAVVFFTLFYFIPPNLRRRRPAPQGLERRCLCDGARVSWKKVCFALGAGGQEMRLKGV